MSVNVKVSCKHTKKTHTLSDVSTMPNLKLMMQTIDRIQIEALKHLKRLADKFCYKDVETKLLIGQDNWHMIIKFACQANKKQPLASYTTLG